MLKLINLSTHPMDLEKFNGKHDRISEFLRENRLDGLELIQSPKWDPGIIPPAVIKGLHLRYWPMWLELWKGDTVELNRQFENKKAWIEFYGGETGNVFVEHYKRELEIASQMGVEYVVFHVGHVQPEHCFTYKFTYGSEEVVDASIELINKVFDGLNVNFDLLFENLWWPGLTMLDADLAGKLMQKVDYRHKGFMLDTSHLMNTNPELENEDEAVDYMLNVLNSLGSVSKFIKGIHLNCSLSGKYVKEQIHKGPTYAREDGFLKQYIKTYEHILKIDNHLPFKYKSIKKVIDYVNPDYLVYEFLTDKLEVMKEYVDIHNCTLDL